MKGDLNHRPPPCMSCKPPLQNSQFVSSFKDVKICTVLEFNIVGNSILARDLKSSFRSSLQTSNAMNGFQCFRSSFYICWDVRILKTSALSRVINIQVHMIIFICMRLKCYGWYCRPFLVLKFEPHCLHTGSWRKLIKELFFISTFCFVVYHLAVLEKYHIQ